MKKIIKEDMSIHPVWQDIEDINEKRGMNFKQMFGKYQYVYTYRGNRISLIQLKHETYAVEWEIFCLEGFLFEDTERYRTKREAMLVIEDYLT